VAIAAVLFAVATLAAWAAARDGGAASRVPKPTIEQAKGERCVEDTEFMRRNHMQLLVHQRDRTTRLGIRTAEHSLKGCIECHASAATGSVAAAKEDFCQSCHSYAAVRIDCFECHARKPDGSARGGKP
jgi:hypothetical protein